MNSISLQRTLKRQAVDGIFSDQMSLQESILSDEVTMSLRGCLKGVAVGAALLPSLRVTYRVCWIHFPSFVKVYTFLDFDLLFTSSHEQQSQ